MCNVIDDIRSRNAVIPLSRIADRESRGHFCEYTRVQMNTSPNDYLVGKYKSATQLEDAKRSKKDPKRQEFNIKISSTTFADVGGYVHVQNELKNIIENPLKHANLYKTLGIEPVKGFLLYGPPGVGKSKIVEALSGEFQLPIITLHSSILISGISGESESNIRGLFEFAKSNAPCIIFLDEIDSICSKKDASSKDMERRIVSQLLACIDEAVCNPTAQPPIFIVGATSKKDTIDPAFRRPGRLEQEIHVNVPDEQCRFEILTVLSDKMKIDPAVDMHEVARNCPGFVAADLSSLVREACNQCVNRLKGQHESSQFDYSSIYINSADFIDALKRVQPSLKREGFINVSGIHWDDVGALNSVKDELKMSMVEPLKNVALFERFGISKPAGVLLWGPPGCGKTLIAKAIASETRSNFIAIKGPELLNKYVGESERAVREVFEKAKQSSPCIIFFDEIDAICPKRDDSEDFASRVVNQILTELDGVQSRKSVYILAATNRPDMIDPALLRPGRLDKCLYVGLPSIEEKFDILKRISKGIPFSQNVDFMLIANDERCIGLR